MNMAKKEYRQRQYHPPKKIKMRSITERFIVAGLILVCIVLVGFSAYMIIRNAGMSKLYRHTKETTAKEVTQKLKEVPIENSIQSEEDALELEEGELFYEGEVWQYNEDIMTFLCMGVDSRKGITNEKTPGKAGQADAILLMVVNPHTSQISIINVNRDSMTDIQIFDTEGGYAGTEKKQLTLQYAYGDGRVKSCELMQEAVSSLFYGIPIHGYAAIDMAAIPTLNDAVGGVSVTVQEDLTRYHPAWTEGSTVTLMGNDALTFIRRRDFESSELGTNIKRMERQKQYLTALMDACREKTKKDITFPITLYGKIQKHVVTSFSLDEITYLASALIGYDFSADRIQSLIGTSAMGKKNEEFYVDEEELKKLVIETFYEKRY